MYGYEPAKLAPCVACPPSLEDVGSHGARRYALDVIPRERLTAIDIRRRVEWLEKHWAAEEWAVSRRLGSFRGELEQLPEPYRARALEGISVLERARIANGHPWRAAMQQIVVAALDWESYRSPLVTCGIDGCQISFRSTRSLLEHRNLVHDVAA